MTSFLGTHQNRLDAKGRVSIPAAFRKELAGGALVLRPSHQYACIEAWPEAAFETLERPLQELPEFSAEQIEKAMTIYGDACKLEADKDGRVMLTGELIAHAGLGETVVFVGLGRIFQIWEPAAAAAFRQGARQRTLERETARQAA